MVKEEKVSKRLAKFKVNIKDAIRYYYVITKPMHKLSDRCIDILTEIMYLYVSEQKNFVKDSDRWKIVLSLENRYNIRNSLDMQKQVFENYMYQLRKAGAIKDNKITPAFNPSIGSDCTGYEITFRFDIIDG
jgi:hypothetical protein